MSQHQMIYRGDKWTRLLGSRVPVGAEVLVLRFFPRRRVLIEYQGQKMTTMLWCLKKISDHGDVEL